MDALMTDGLKTDGLKMEARTDRFKMGWIEYRTDGLMTDQLLTGQKP